MYIKSGSGKTSFARKFICSKLYSGQINSICYFYNDLWETCPDEDEWNSLGNKAFYAYPGLPNKEFFQNIKPHTCVIIDDSYHQVVKSETIASAMTVFRETSFFIF